jgi:hypothetical protein
MVVELRVMLKIKPFVLPEVYRVLWPAPPRKELVSPVEDVLVDDDPDDVLRVDVVPVDEVPGP